MLSEAQAMWQESYIPIIVVKNEKFGWHAKRHLTSGAMALLALKKRHSTGQCLHFILFYK